MANPDEFIRFNLRLPKELSDELDRAAADRKTSKNSEIVRRLEDSFKAPSIAVGAGEIDMATVERLMDLAADKVLKRALQALAAGLKDENNT